MVEIKIDEKFRHLNHAPIVEAAIDLRARASVELDEKRVREAFEPEFPGYTFLDSQQLFEFDATVKDGKPSQAVVDHGWKGVRFQAPERVVQVNKNGFVFSRLPPYQDWKEFSQEGLRMWEFFKKTALPTEIHRIGLRFINRIPLPNLAEPLEKYLSAPLAPLAPDANFALPVAGFMHHNVLTVPGHPYAVNLVRTLQPSPSGSGFAVIVDIDVFTGNGFGLHEAKLLHYLAEMRWLKNKVFFGSITKDTEDLCQ